MTAGTTLKRMVRSRRSGQLTIPSEFRKALGIGDQSLLEVTLTDGELRIKPVDSPGAGGAPAWLKDAYLAFAPIREELAERYSESEIDEAIDAAVKAVRQARD